ncbi:P-loop NTPase fold protein [Microbispora sp. KK1-11]|uniref:P-loop NTPase fold protein n=1 Tax=Microbispora sp. KK1-11 TaxID=2053005 RepID=UPI001156DA4F|nr:P-loop NTPase fold protein [Microbispora sp. KK1-11]TQS26677.1 serine protease [Microbispora sp. KK1-11]
MSTPPASTLEQATVEQAVARIADETGTVAGAGVLVAADLVLTCAHVITGGREEQPETVLVDFPFLRTGPSRARVHFLAPAKPGSDLATGDLAVLRLETALPPDVRPVEFAPAAPPGLQVSAYGFPHGYPDGRWASGRTVGSLPNGAVQLEATDSAGFTAGYSGAPVWSPELGAALGILFAADGQGGRAGYMSTAPALAETWPEFDAVVRHTSADGATGARRRSPGEFAPGGRERTQWVSDAPADRDVLRRAALANVLARQLRHARAEAPDASFLVHIDGSWGTGKSTLLKLLARDLRSDSIVAFFDTWRHVRIEPPWWALLTTIRKAVVQHRPPWRRPFFLVRELLARVRRDGAPQVLSGLLLVGTALLAAFLFRAGVITVRSVEPTFKTVTTLVGAAGALWTAGVLVSRYAMWGSARRARTFEQSHTDPMNDVAEHIAWLVRHAGRPIVVFVEDLDRCNADYVVNFLDSVQTLVRDVPEHWRRPARRTPDFHAPSFVVAMDGAWLRCAYENAYETFTSAVAEPGRPIGYLFLDKLFQLSVPMPKLGGASRDLYFGELLGVSVAKPPPATADQVRAALTTSGDEIEVLETLAKADPRVREIVASQAVERILDAGVQDVSHHALAKFSRLLHSNPRAMKRFVNTYTVLRAVRVLEGSLVPTDTLALWTLLRIRWPELADYLESHPEAVDRITEGSGVQDLPESLRELAASRDLHEVLCAVPGVTLTADVIRACSGAGDDLAPLRT